MTGLAIEHLRIRLGDNTAVNDISLTVGRGCMLALVGPNGSGKTSLLRSIYRAVNASGTARIDDGQDLLTMRRRHVAHWVAATVQETPDTSGMTAREAIGLGRLPHTQGLARETTRDREAVQLAAHRADVDHLLGRELATLSGGERQRVHLARALAQQTPVLLLDEPTNHLDLAHQLAVLRLVRDLRVTTIAALHDLTLAARWCDQIAVLANGHLVALGKPCEALTSDLIADVFGVAGRWIDIDGQPRLLIDAL